MLIFESLSSIAIHNKNNKKKNIRWKLITHLQSSLDFLCLIFGNKENPFANFWILINNEFAPNLHIAILNNIQ